MVGLYILLSMEAAQNLISTLVRLVKAAFPSGFLNVPTTKSYIRKHLRKILQGVPTSLGLVILVDTEQLSFVKCISNCNITPYGVFAEISPIVWCVDDGYLLSALWSSPYALYEGLALLLLFIPTALVSRRKSLLVIHLSRSIWSLPSPWKADLFYSWQLFC